MSYRPLANVEKLERARPDYLVSPGVAHRITLKMSGGKRSHSAEVHLELVTEELGRIQSWPSDKTFSVTVEAPKVLYVLGSTQTKIDHIWTLYKKYKAAAGADADPFSS